MRRPHARSVLALALTLLLVPASGCLGGTDDAPDADAPPDREQTDHMASESVRYTFSGTATGTPAEPDVHAFPVDVAQGAIGIQATVTWEDAPVTRFTLDLVDPNGDVVASGFPESDGKRSAATVEPPRSGEWIIRVSGERAVDTPFEVNVEVSFIVPLDNVLADTVEMRAGGFAELNLIMDANATINWSFESSNGPVKWNIHTHENGETQYLEEGLDEAYASAFTAPKRHIYSIMFESTAPTTLTYEVEGAFRVHSHSQ